MQSNLSHPNNTRAPSARTTSLYQAHQGSFGILPRNAPPTPYWGGLPERQGHSIRNACVPSPPSHTRPLYATVPLPMGDHEPPAHSEARSQRYAHYAPSTPPSFAMLPSPPPSPSSSTRSAQPPPYIHTLPTNTNTAISRPVYLHHILESILFVPPHMTHNARRPLSAEINNHLTEPATVPGLGFLSIVLLPSGRSVPVQPSAAGRGIVTLGDVLHGLKELSDALLGGDNLIGAGEAALSDRRQTQHGPRGRREGPQTEGLWTWVVDGKSAAGYLAINVEDVVWTGR